MKDAAPKSGTWGLGEEGTIQDQLQPMQRKMGEEVEYPEPSRGFGTS